MKKVLLSLGAFLFSVAGWAQAWQDVTDTYVKNAGMTENADTQTAWQVEGLTDNGPKDGYNIYGFYSGWGSLERTAGSATQEITLPAGNYKLTGYGFFRDGVAYNTNPTVSLGYMFAGEEELLLPTLGSVEGLNSYANDFPGGSDAFYNQNLYLNELEFSMADEGTIAIGFRCTFERKQSWMLIGKMTLYKEMSYAEMFEAKKANLNALLEELDGITVYSTTIPATMTEAETVMAGEDKEAQLRMLDSLETLYTKAQVLLPKAKEAKELMAACQTLGGSTTEKADGAKDALDNALTAAKADLAQADTNESMDRAMDGIEAARRNYLLQALPAEGETLDFTFLIDGIGNSTNGWVREFVNFSRNYQYQNASNKNNGDLQKTGYIEAWNNGVEFTGTLTYTATELPIGRYNISAYTFQAANDTVMLFANDKSVELDHGTELYTLSKVEDVAVNGTLSLGLDMAKGATWTGITNIRLEYVGQLDAATTYAAFQAAYEQLKVYADGSLNTALNADVKAMTDSYADMDQTDVTAMEMAYIALTAKAKELQTLSGLYADVKAAYEAAEAEAGNSTETAEGAKAMFEAALEAQAAALDAATTAEELNAVAEAVETARQAYVVNARPNVGCTLDYTFKIVNPSFETGDLTGWTATTANDTGVKPNSNGTYTINNADGDYVFNTWGGTAEKNVQQTVTGLPASVYSLTVLLASDAGISVNVTAGSVTNTFTLSKDKANGEDFSVENVTVGEDGQLLVKVASNDWYKVDNFRLNRVGMATASVAITEITPAPEDETLEEGISEFTLTFDKDVTLNAGEDAPAATLTSGSNVQIALTATAVEGATNQIRLTPAEAVTEAGTYTLNIPEMLVLDAGGNYNAATTQAYVIPEKPVTPETYEYESVDPAAGKVESLKDITLTFAEGTFAFVNTEAEGKAYLLNIDTEEQIEVTLESASKDAETDLNKILAVVAEDVTEAGSYTLVIPAKAIAEGNDKENSRVVDYSPEIRIDYTIEKEEGDGIQAIWAQGGTADIYSVTGLLVKKNATANDVKALKKGIYIVNGKKFIKK